MDCVIRIDGHLSEGWTAWFSGLVLVAWPAGSTELVGKVPDQAALLGVLNLVRDMGMTLQVVRASRSLTDSKKELEDNV